MIKLRIRQVAKRQGINSAAELERFLHVPHSVGGRLWAGTPIPRLGALETYALKLGCRIEDLYLSTRLPSAKNGEHDSGDDLPKV
jgi:hypothetical protein